MKFGLCSEAGTPPSSPGPHRRPTLSFLLVACPQGAHLLGVRCRGRRGGRRTRELLEVGVPVFAVVGDRVDALVEEGHVVLALAAGDGVFGLVHRDDEVVAPAAFNSILALVRRRLLGEDEVTTGCAQELVAA